MNLKSILAQRGIKHQFIADELGISASNFSWIVSGRVRFPPDKVQDLCALLNRRYEKLNPRTVQRLLDGERIARRPQQEAR